MGGAGVFAGGDQCVRDAADHLHIAFVRPIVERAALVTAGTQAPLVKRRRDHSPPLPHSRPRRHAKFRPDIGRNLRQDDMTGLRCPQVLAGDRPEGDIAGIPGQFTTVTGFASVT